jgi:hypothetical protein
MKSGGAHDLAKTREEKFWGRSSSPAEPSKYTGGTILDNKTLINTIDNYLSFMLLYAYKKNWINPNDYVTEKAKSCIQANSDGSHNLKQNEAFSVVCKFFLFMLTK